MTDYKTDSLLPQFPHSYWLEHEFPRYPSLLEDKQTEVGVIGGGIVGILTAYLLAKAGKQVTLIEARELLSGVTGNTTAKVTAQTSMIYNELISTFGEEKARLYYDANTEGMHSIEQIAKELSIDCDWETKDASIYASTAKGLKQLEKEARAYETLAIDGVLTNGQVNELPFKTTGALTMPDQAQFHPVKFLAPLLNEIERLGGSVYERTRAIKVCKGKMRVHLESGFSLDCDKVVVATHYPFNDFQGLYFSKLSIERSYSLVATTDAPLVNGMYISAESPSRSLRSVRNDKGEDFLLIGGDGHQTGKSSEANQEHYQNLEDFGKRYFAIKDIPNHWSAQDMTTLDKVPYVGQMIRSTPNILLATGFNKWGMAMGAVAAKVLTDNVLNKPNVYADLFNPLRNKLKAKDVQQFTWKNTAVGKDLVVTKAKRPTMTPDDLEPDQGGLVSVDGKKVGGYRDAKGHVHLVKTTCTHMGCGLNWNDAERSWDCPCHGSRFTYAGEVIDGPAVKPLEKLDNSCSCKHHH